MLPEALSNELCSLKPNVDRLTKCVEFVLSQEGHVVSAKFYAAVIRSKRRFTYKEAFAALQKPPTNEIEQMLHDTNAMAQQIRGHRFLNGSLDLDFPENKIRLDDHGKVLRIERIENDISHQLIEEYMLLANEAVAGRLMQLNRPSVYRIHESPKEKRLNDYREEVLSHRVPCGNLTHRPEVQKLLAKLGTLPIGQALKILERTKMDIGGVVPVIRHLPCDWHATTQNRPPVRPVTEVGERYDPLTGHTRHFAQNVFCVVHGLQCLG
jgi:ribonuclease R